MIEVACEEDIENIMELVNECVEDLESKEIYQWNDYYPTRNHITESIKDKTLYLFKDNEDCLGMISVTDKQPLEYEKLNWTSKNSIIVITKLAVNPKYQNQGIGQILLNFAEDLAMNNSCSIRLDVFSENPRAINLYEKNGYTRVGITYFPKRELPFYCYEKIID